MTTTRYLPAVVLLTALAGGPAAGQQFNPLPAGYPGGGGPPGMRPAGDFPGAALPGGPADRAPTAVERVSMRSEPGAAPSDPAATLAGMPSAGTGGMTLPPGSYASPWTGEKPGCCGPLGGGPLGYELYLETGPNFMAHVSDLGRVLRDGWTVGGGTRSLLFNTDNSAAWVINLGLSFTYNRGDQSSVLSVIDKGSQSTSSTTGQTTTTAPALRNFVVRDLDRTSFNFSLGRDWWLWGPGATGYESGWNMRVGPEFGGKWGTAHVDMLPTADLVHGYFRRQGVYHSVFAGFHGNVEVPMGSWIWFSGLNVQYSYDWTNLIPPLNGDLGSVNVLLQTGVRF